MEKLVQKYYSKYSFTQTKKVRHFMQNIDWSNRLIGIKGSRGIGKTTLLLQYIKLHFEIGKKALYISLDDLYFAENKLYNLAEKFHLEGGELIVIDEVHRYENWAIEIKNLYDDFPNLKIIFTGSSLLHIQYAKADLSRRAVVYNMPGLSFREFLEFENDIELPFYNLENLLENHSKISIDIIEKIKPLEHFSNYLNLGYYPFYNENKNVFHQKLSELILTVLEVDITQFASLQVSNIVYLKKLLTIISHSVPFKPNMKKLSERTGISLNTMKQYMKLLHDAELINLLYAEDKGIQSLYKPEKVYLNNTNLMYNLASENANIGNIRETFFFNQLNFQNKVKASNEVDFYVADKYSFEIGGKNKSQKQAQGLKNAYIIKDGIEIGSGNIVPLWLFGFLY